MEQGAVDDGVELLGEAEGTDIAEIALQESGRGQAAVGCRSSGLLDREVVADALRELDFVWAAETAAAIKFVAENATDAQAAAVLAEANQASVKKLVELIITYGLPREALPTEALNRVEVWEALLQEMPMTAMIRNLGTMSKVGLLKPLSDAEKLVYQRLTDAERLKFGRAYV
mgnify:CR=1 FL=1